MRAFWLVPVAGVVAIAACASSQDVPHGGNGDSGAGASDSGLGGSSSGGAASGGTGAASTGGRSAGGTAGGGTDAGVGGGTTDGGGSGGSGSAKTCSSGFVTGLDPGGNPICQTLGAATQAAVRQSCSIYLGWQDSCDGCTTPPTKWGYASGDATCANGAGASDVCIAPTLGTNAVSLIGINTDGTVNGDDKFYTSLHCAAVTPATTTGQTACPAGQFATAVSGSTVSCATLADLVTAYFGTSCRAYFGWRDSCNGCTSPPSKWGSANDSVCANGTGTNDTCTQPTLGTETVNLFGLNTDGTVDDTDSFYLGLHCTGASTATSTDQAACPAGQFVTGINASGTVDCASPAADIEAYVRSGCYAYLGWHDSCSGCATPPTKWGRANDTTCDRDPTSNSVCISASLGGETVNLFVLNTDGAVNDDDQFYAGLVCF